jgi:hypothetical protein
MEPYLEFIKAVIQDHDSSPELDAIRLLPLEKRYVWRVASALKWGFADFDDLGVEADKRTLTPEDFAKVMDLLKLRPMQFFIFLKALVGIETMQKIMVQAIGVGRSERTCRPDAHRKSGIAVLTIHVTRLSIAEDEAIDRRDNHQIRFAAGSRMGSSHQ